MFKQRQFSNVFYPGLLEGDNKPWPQSHEDRGNDQRCRFDLAGTPTLLEKEVAAWVYIYIDIVIGSFLSVCVCQIVFIIVVIAIIDSYFVCHHQFVYHCILYVYIYNYM